MNTYCHRQHHLGIISSLRTFTVQAITLSPGFSTGKQSPVTVSFFRIVPLQQFISSLSISMYSSMPEIVHKLVQPPNETLSVTAPLLQILIYGRLSKVVVPFVIPRRVARLAAKRMILCKPCVLLKFAY